MLSWAWEAMPPISSSFSGSERDVACVRHRCLPVVPEGVLPALVWGSVQHGLAHSECESVPRRVFSPSLPRRSRCTQLSLPLLSARSICFSADV